MYERQIELSGHIIDSLALPKTMDIIMDKGGDFDIIKFDVGKRKSDISRAKMMVSAESPDVLDGILDELSVLGVSIAEIKEANLVASPKDKVAPEGFYSTTNYVTHVLYKGNWLLVNNTEMDCMILIDETKGKAYCKPLNDLKKGDKIVVGRDGIKVAPPERVRGKQGGFEFMNSDVSSEKPLLSIAKDIASEIKEVKSKGGKIALVGGPAIVHTGSAKFIAALIREGIIDVVFAGNALATHDIESDQFGTSLGINVETGEIVSHGHTHHMRAINRINKSGSIEAAVKDGTLKSGIMYECVKNNVPYVLAGSIRDDGPLPDVITDTAESQAKMRYYCQKIDMCLMVSTMLHSIATGNMLSARVKSICIDINPSTVTKLADRGSAQVMRVVTDIGAFLPVLYECLHEDSFISENLPK
ncbi:MAG: TIGR00300 family protein [Methanobacteriaceae archaeon]|jgi:lysine-ketoglutarate reductase/saccharopine dehydrogenase-like protein (TIGR00300 family)|uniref:ornithine cyclodeaminase n=1 Tax=unclassified Methanobrevibacter TaxID=2638681 RepID=UPI0037649B94|nr:TIGR00300 family protein [Methanobacteriaceae archaeon]MDD4594274.1 TIGR00300 family protein [Methanobacteriaceae archaeon]